MKKIVLLIVLMIPFIWVSGQTRPKIGGAKADSMSFKDDNWTKWATGISDDATLAGNGHKKLVTEYAVKQHVANAISSAGGIASLQDSIAKHTDSLQRHNVRLKTMELIKHSHSNISILNATTASFTTTLSTAISTATSTNTTQGDTLVSHNTRIKAVKTLSHSHTNKSILDLITSAFRDADSTRLKRINDTAYVMIRVTDDTLTTTEVFSGDIFPIGRMLNGWNLAQVEAFSPGNGNGTASIKVYRNRGGTVIEVTPIGADINGLATIEPTADDVVTGDYYRFGAKETGTSPYSIAVDVYLKFVKP